MKSQNIFILLFSCFSLNLDKHWYDLNKNPHIKYPVDSIIRIVYFYLQIFGNWHKNKHKSTIWPSQSSKILKGNSAAIIGCWVIRSLRMFFHSLSFYKYYSIVYHLVKTILFKNDIPIPLRYFILHFWGLDWVCVAL